MIGLLICIIGQFLKYNLLIKYGLLCYLIELIIYSACYLQWLDNKHYM